MAVKVGSRGGVWTQNGTEDDCGQTDLGGSGGQCRNRRKQPENETGHSGRETVRRQPENAVLKGRDREWEGAGGCPARRLSPVEDRAGSVEKGVGRRWRRKWYGLPFQETHWEGEERVGAGGARRPGKDVFHGNCPCCYHPVTVLHGEEGGEGRREGLRARLLSRGWDGIQCPGGEQVP